MTPADEAASEPSPDSGPVPEVLLHSLGILHPVILPALAIAGARQIVEVGVEAGQMTGFLRDYIVEVDGRCIGIDPVPDEQVRAVYSSDPRLELVEGRSPDALEGLESADAYLVDGDHNYWTVLGELQAIAAAAGTDRHPLVFLHDVGWPAGRRDQYYAPDQLPPEAVHPFTYAQGVRMGVPGTVDGGFRGEGVFAWAIEEGGPRNGVRTALEDFLEEFPRFRAVIVPSVFGLAVVSTVDAPFTAALDAHLRAWADNAVLATVEENRLALYDRVLILQDLLADAGDGGPRLRNENARAARSGAGARSPPRRHPHRGRGDGLPQGAPRGRPGGAARAPEAPRAYAAEPAHRPSSDGHHQPA